MQRRRFVMASAASALAAPFAGLAGCVGDSSDDPPSPMPPSGVVLSLPKDMYLHRGAPTEWWWHIGTLRAGSRTFGFEINATSMAQEGFGFSQIMLSDVDRQKHYQRTVGFVPPFMFDADTWAESDVSKDWYARLGSADNFLSTIEVTNPGSGYTSAPVVAITGGGGGGAAATALLDGNGGVAAILLLSPGAGYTSAPNVTINGGGGAGATARAVHSYVAMEAPAADPTQNISVKAFLQDQFTPTEVRFDLRFSQQGRPFFVWGTGINPGGQGDSLQTNNFYFSLTRLHASGSIEIDGELLAVSGVTWMDHEYGAFGTAANPIKWFLQDMQLDNGVCISNYVTLAGNEKPELNTRMSSMATVQDASGDTWFVPTYVTPVGRTWTSPRTGSTYFLQARVEIPAFDADLTVTSLVDGQEFPSAVSSIYEGVAAASGTFRRRHMTGTAWLEQAF